MSFVIKVLKEQSQESIGELYNSLLGEQLLKRYELQVNTIKYNLEYLKSEIVDLSICLYHNENPIIIVFVYLIDGELNYFKQPIKIVHDSEYDNELLDHGYKLILNKFDEFIKLYNPSVIYFDENHYFLKRYLRDISKIENQYISYIDLKNSILGLKRKTRTSFKQYLNWGEKNLTILYVESDSEINKKLFEEFRLFHIKVSGKETRSLKSWLIQYESIILGEAYLVLSFYNDKMVGGSFILHGTSCAFYGVGVYDRELMKEKIPIAHFTLMNAIYKAKDIGLSIFELGQLDFENNDEKIGTISMFKSGFSNTIRIKNNFKI